MMSPNLGPWRAAALAALLALAGDRTFAQAGALPGPAPGAASPAAPATPGAAARPGRAEPVLERLAALALSLRGVPYAYGAESPASFDCSGFSRYVYREAAGIVLPHGSKGQALAGRAVDPRSPEPGDLLVFDTGGAGTPSHVAIVLEGGRMIHAVSEGPRTGVIVSPLDDPYFAPRLIGARRLLGLPAGTQAPAATGPRPPAAVAGPGPARDAPLAEIALAVGAPGARYADPVPARPGTRLAFALANGTGGAGRFSVVFYAIAPRGGSLRLIHAERVSIGVGGAVELPPLLFAEPGRYRLVVKDSWNAALLERDFFVSD